MIPLCVLDNLTCSHGGKVVFTPEFKTEFQVRGVPLLTEDDVRNGIIVGCPHMMPGTNTPKPCLRIVSAQVSAFQFRVKGKPVAVVDKISTIVTDNGVPVSLSGSPFCSGVFDIKW